MGTPYCDKFGDFATMKFCHEHCNCLMSNRRPPCEDRRPRRWDDVPKSDRAVMVGNAEYKRYHLRMDNRLQQIGSVSEELRAAAERNRKVDKKTGRATVNVPIETLQALQKLLDVTIINSGSQRPSMGL